MTPAQLKARYPNASPAFIQANSEPDASGVHPMLEQQPKRNALDRVKKRKAASTSRFEIVFTVYAVRPFDWDGNHIKELQDALIRAGILHDDNWRVLRGSIDSQKAHSPQEERTEIKIYEITDEKLTSVD